MTDPTADATSAPDPDAHMPTLTLREPDDDATRVLREGQLLLLKYPLAAQALFRSFVAEGRRYGETEEGQQWAAALGDSDLIRRGRVVWEVATLKLLEERSPSLLPSKLLDAFVDTANSDGLEGLLTSLFENGASDAPAGPANTR
ncbi:hypothetical protein OAX78_01790 [Planctomycetota bacterium]|nr:hypothetical protein [Planctomycetota bacterium]